MKNEWGLSQACCCVRRWHWGADVYDFVADKGKSSMYRWMDGRIGVYGACVGVRFFRESIIVIASCHGTEQQEQSIVFCFFLTFVLCRRSWVSGRGCPYYCSR